MVSLVEFPISEEGFDDVLGLGLAGSREPICHKTNLAIVESSPDSDVVDVRIGDRGHLSLLNRGHTSFRVEDEN